MSKERGNANSKHPKFGRVPLAELRQLRRGKHHELITGILAELDKTPEKSAVSVPLAAVNLSLSDLRSAMSHAAKARGIEVATFSDDNNFYVWKKTRNTAKWERKGRSSSRSS